MKSPSTRGLGFMARIDPGCTRGMLIWQKEAHLAIHGGDGSTLRASAPSCGRQGRRTSSVGLQRPPFVLDRPMRGRSDPRRTRTILHHTFETNSPTNGPERARWHPRVLGPRTVWTAVFSGKERSSTGVASCDVGTDTCLFPGPKGKPASNAPLRRDETSPSRTELSCVPPSPARVPPFRPARTCLLSCVLIGPFENRGRRTAVRKASNRPPAVPLAPSPPSVRHNVRLAGRPAFSLVRSGASHVSGAEGSFPLLIDTFLARSTSFIDTFALLLFLRDPRTLCPLLSAPRWVDNRSVWTRPVEEGLSSMAASWYRSARNRGASAKKHARSRPLCAHVILL